MKRHTADTDRGLFQAIDSFAIKRRGEFYIVGQLIEGEVQEQWCANIALSATLAVSLTIKQIETIDMAGESPSYQLLIVAADAEEISLLLALKIGFEPIVISTQGTA
ncbi:hypothetical protein [Hymenobacter metallicola]|uniref:Uncharacterized protein n=1 Tax=Hymenobacter metallicola TaxID=2563114 RepID=A0A4Z0QD26_9BACT|nr:hypothetical protein [Hymenobacter metallicola]TGE27386.1 hypothetical protein E5K02_13480 [Hymenobacter metallicola]